MKSKDLTTKTQRHQGHLFKAKSLLGSLSGGWRPFPSAEAITRRHREVFFTRKVLLGALVSWWFAFSAYAATHVTATYDLGPSPRVMATVNGQPQYGLVFAQRSGAVTWNNVQYGTQVLAGYLDAQGRLNDGAGNLWLDLIPNLGAVPDGTYYVVTFNLQGQVHAEIWVVPDVATATAGEVRQSQAPSAAAPAVFYQFIQKDGADLPQRRKLNLAGAGVTCADNSGALSTDCTIPGGGGGGSAPLASPTVSGTVKIDASSADPVVYLKSSSDSLLAAKANATHTHAQADVSNLESDLAAKAPAARTISTTSPLAGGGDLSQDRTLSCPTCEVTGNKNQASGYAGLDASSKISASQASEVLGVADLTDFAGKSGSGTTAIGATITTPAADQCLVWNGSTWVNGSCAAGGGGITSLNSQTGSTQTFSKVDDTNVTLTISSATDNHQFALGWTGTLAAARLNSNVVQAVTNDANVTGTISAQNLTLGWTGTLAKTRQNSATAYRDEANVFTAAGGVTLDNQLGLRLREATANGTDYIEHRAAGTLAANTTYTWPASTDSRFLFSGTGGALAWNEASGVGGCTNQFVRTLTNNAAPTCATVATTDLADNAITDGKLRDSAGFSVIGKATTGTGDPADIAVASDRLLGRSGSGDLGGVQVVTNHITDANVTPAKLSTAARAVNKSLSLENPATGDSLKWMVMHESHAVTLTRVYCAVLGGTSVTINVTKTAEATPFSGGTDALTSNLVCDTDGANSTAFTSAGVAANTPLMLKITAVSGSVTNLILGVHATRD